VADHLSRTTTSLVIRGLRWRHGEEHDGIVQGHHVSPLEVGDQVEVHTNFDDVWVPGFEIAEIVPEGYRVRREFDDTLLPGYTSEADVRRGRRGARP
jgi:hypothetical protein